MMMLLWMCLMTLVITSQHVNSKVITINTNGGSDNTTCCIDGECDCSSLSTALTNITNDTVINITSESVTLEEHIVMGSGDNITIIGNGVTIMCNYSGIVELTCSKVCTNIVIEGITWDRCGGHNLPTAVLLDTVTNVSLRNCIFQYSQVQAVKINTVYGSVIIDNCSFVFNVRGLEILKSNRSSDLVGVNVLIYNSNFSSNGDSRYITNDNTGLYVHEGRTPTVWSIAIFKTVFSFNVLAVYLNLTGGNITLTEVLVHDNLKWYPVFYLNFDGYHHQTTILSILSSLFIVNHNAVLQINAENGITTLIKNSAFIENQSDFDPIIDLHVTSSLYGLDNCSLILIDVQVTENVFTPKYSIESMGIFSAQIQCTTTKLVMKQVSVTSNVYPSHGGVVYIKNNLKLESHQVNISESVFANNTSLRGSTIYIDQIQSGYLDITSDFSIRKSVFDRNLAQNNVIYIKISGPPFQNTLAYFEKLNFTNNYGSCIFLTQLCQLSFEEDVLFENNTADNGPALYLDQTSTITINKGANVQFINNSAALHGGAIFIEYQCDYQNSFPVIFYGALKASFINNIAGLGPNAIYFSVFKYCNLIVNSSDTGSIMHVPYQFNYSQIINGTLTHVPTDYNYTWLNVTQFPVVTSPHQLKLYGDDIQLINNNTYFVGNKVLGRPVTFHGIVLDYFDKPAEVTRFHLTCIYCSSNWSLLNTFLSVDNVSPLNVILVGEEVVNNFNVTLNLRSSINNIYNLIDVTLIVELVPCPVHPGYYYSDTSKGCVCYHHDVVECYEGYNEIKRGYWFGVVNGIVTTSLCPSQYCKFANRRKTRDGYFELPDTVDNQCEHHRAGTACGECSTGYTLAYDSSDCISIDHCSTGMTVLVVVLTCLYWIAVVVGVFILMYFNFQLSLGYLYGIVYYYSLTDILLNYNPYISRYAIQFVNIQSGFVQLTPQVLRQFCLVEGMTTIDQLFIHSFHAGAVLTLLLALVLVTRYSRKVSAFIRRCIIRILCLLLLLVYTSLSSTLLQPLRPLTFTGIKEVYTNSSPNFEYFRGRHMLYGIVALFCEVVVVIGVPMLLLLEKLFNRKVNLVKLKPILDQFKGCYKDKYHWFACYYMICRQVIMVQIMVLGSDESDYYSMLLQTTCVIIAAIHIWLQPYKNKFLNLFDGIILVLIVLIVNINTFDLPPSVTTDLVLVLVILPLVVLCAAGIIKKIKSLRRRRRHHYVAINEESDEDDDQNAMR